MRSKLSGQSVLRKIVGSILSSNLSSREILDISNELMHGSELAFEIAHALRLSMEALNEEPNMRFEPDESEPTWLPILIDRIQKSKITKGEVISMLPKRYISNMSYPTLHKMSLKSLLLRAFEDASPSSINSFVRRIGADSEPDPYLAGIEKKN